MSRAEPDLSTPVLDVVGLTLSYRADILVEDMSFSLAPSEVLGLKGPNGSGKTTFLNCLSGWHTFRSGEIKVTGRSIKKLLPEDISDLGVRRSFQGGRVMKTLTAPEYMALTRLGSELHKHRRIFLSAFIEREIEQALRWIQNLLGHTAFVDKLIIDKLGFLSGGQQRFVCVLAAIYGASTIVLLDEPFSGLAPGLAGLLVEVVRQEIYNRRLAAVIIEHNTEYLTKISRKTLTLLAHETGGYRARLTDPAL